MDVIYLMNDPVPTSFFSPLSCSSLPITIEAIETIETIKTIIETIAHKKRAPAKDARVRFLVLCFRESVIRLTSARSTSY